MAVLALSMVHDDFLGRKGARDDVEREHREGDDERADPGEPLPVGIGAERELEDDDRQARHRGVQVGREELVVERGEQQRRGLAGDAGDGEQDAGDDPGLRRAVGHVADHMGARHAERGRGLAQLVRHQGSMSSVVRTTTGMTMIASATAPAQPEKWPIGATMIS